MSRVNNFRFSKNAKITNINDGKTIEQIVREEIFGDVDGSLLFEGKALYQVVECQNMNPQEPKDIGTNIFIVTPTDAWQRICENNKFKKVKTKDERVRERAVKDHNSEIDDNALSYSIVSCPFDNNRERVDAFEYLIEEAHNDLDKVLNLIEKNKAQDKGR